MASEVGLVTVIFPLISLYLWDWLAASFLNPDWFTKLATPILVTDRSPFFLSFSMGHHALYESVDRPIEQFSKMGFCFRTAVYIFTLPLTNCRYLTSDMKCAAGLVTALASQEALLFSWTSSIHQHQD